MKLSFRHWLVLNKFMWHSRPVQNWPVTFKILISFLISLTNGGVLSRNKKSNRNDGPYINIQGGYKANN